jgi:hypothetical protein
MPIELTTHECEYLKHLLDNARKELLHELHHARAIEFKDVLKQQLDVNESLVLKIEPALVSR